MGDDIDKLQRKIKNQSRALDTLNAKVKMLKAQNMELRKQLADKEKPRT